MRVLLVVHQFFPDFSSGTEELTLETAHALQARGHQVEVLAGHPCRDRPGRRDSYAWEGIPVTRYNHDRVAMGGNPVVMALEYDNAWLGELFREILLRFRPHLVHFFHLQRLSTAAIVVCEQLGVPALLTVTDYWTICPTVQLLLPDHRHCPGPSAGAANCIKHLAVATQPAPMRWAARAMPEAAVRLLTRIAGAGPRPLPFANMRAAAARPAVVRARIGRLARVLAPTPFMVEFLRNYGIPADIIRLQPFGIRPTQRIERPPRPPGAPLRIGFIGTLCDHKGAHVLVDATRALADSIAVEVGIYGDLRQFPAYSAKIRARAAPDRRIAFRGTFPRHEFADVVAGLDLLVVPSLWHENTPLVLLKAQALGCPVVGSDVAGIAETVRHGVNGVLVEAGDAAALARALMQLAGDPAMLDALAAQSVQSRTIDSYADELVELYHELAPALRE